MQPLLLPPFLDATSDFLAWFSASLAGWLVPLMLMIFVLMFFFAVIKAPLDVLGKKKTAKLMPVLLLAQTNISEVVTDLSAAFFGVLGLLIVVVLPLVLILMLYKAFMQLIKT